MGNVETAELLSRIGGIISVIVGISYVIIGFGRIWFLPHIFMYFVPLISLIIYGVVAILFGLITLFVVRPHITEGGDLKTAAIMCFIFGAISAGAIGGILTVVAGIILILAWTDVRKVDMALPPSTTYTPPPPTTPPAETPSQKTPTAYCSNCGAALRPNAVYCQSCGTKV